MKEAFKELMYMEGYYGAQVINVLRLLVAVFSALFGLHLLGAF